MISDLVMYRAVVRRCRNKFCPPVNYVPPRTLFTCELCPWGTILTGTKFTVNIVPPDILWGDSIHWDIGLDCARCASNIFRGEQYPHVLCMLLQCQHSGFDCTIIIMIRKSECGSRA